MSQQVILAGKAASSSLLH